MRKGLFFIVFSFVLISLISGCKKLEINQQSEEALFNKSSLFLKSMLQTVSTNKALKIQKIIDNLSQRNIKEINTYKQHKAIVCDLVSYKKYSKDKFKDVFYKVIFKLRDKEIIDAFIYTIYTNENESYINENITSILKGNDVKFSGEITTNALDDKYLLTKTFKNGKLESTRELQINISKDKNHITESLSAFNSGNTIKSNTINCIDWYEVTTYYYSDGHSEQTWSYLRTTCSSSCGYGDPTEVKNFCDFENGGGGSGGDAADSTNPCDNADTLAKKADFISRMDSLKLLANQQYETGYFFVKNLDGTNTYTKQSGALNSASIQPNLTNSISGYMHNHYSSLLSIFSGSDLRQMYDWLKKGKLSDPSTFTMSLVTADSTTYMMQIDDILKFQHFGQKWMNDDLIFHFFESQYMGRYNISQTGNRNNYLSGFLRMLDEYNTGIKFFSGDYSTFSNWSPKKYESNGTTTGGTIVNSPC